MIKLRSFVYHFASKSLLTYHLLKFAYVPIQPVIIARNLCVIFKNDSRMDGYIKNICRLASYALYKIASIMFILHAVSISVIASLLPSGHKHFRTSENQRLSCQTRLLYLRILTDFFILVESAMFRSCGESEPLSVKCT